MTFLWMSFLSQLSEEVTLGNLMRFSIISSVKDEFETWLPRTEFISFFIEQSWLNRPIETHNILSLTIFYRRRKADASKVYRHIYMNYFDTWNDFVFSLHLTNYKKILAKSVLIKIHWSVAPLHHIILHILNFIIARLTQRRPLEASRVFEKSPSSELWVLLNGGAYVKSSKVSRKIN